jgi:hypothetical protein
MTTPTDPELIEGLGDEVIAKLHELLAAHPDYLLLGADPIAAIFHAGVKAGLEAARQGLR